MMTNTQPTSKAIFYGGWAASILPAIVLVLSAAAKLSHNPEMLKQFQEKFGYQESIVTPLGIVEALCTILYLIPQTSVLGAVLLTGYLGGAVATHVRIGESPLLPFAVGVIAWLGLYLRDSRLRELLPLRK